MLYLVALLCPPLAVLCCGRFLASIGNFVLMVIGASLIPVGVGLVFWVIAMAHAWGVVKQTKQPCMPYPIQPHGGQHVVIHNYSDRRN